MSKTKEELVAEESEIDLNKPVVMPPEVAAIFNRGFSKWIELPRPHEYDLELLKTAKDVEEMLRDMYFNPDNPAIAYLLRGKPLPPAVDEYKKSELLQIEWNDHYYRRTERDGDWYRLPEEFQVDIAGDEPRDHWPAAIRKIVRNSPRYLKLEFQLSKKAVLSIESSLRRNELAEATRPEIIEARPGFFGFALNVRALWMWLRPRISFPLLRKRAAKRS